MPASTLTTSIPRLILVTYTGADGTWMVPALQWQMEYPVVYHASLVLSLTV
jgi:hypothetical protein